MKLYLVGDVMIGRSFGELFKHFPDWHIWGNLPLYLKNDDYLLGNLETTLTSSEDRSANKIFTFKLHPQQASILQELPFKFLSLANNHIFDYKVRGMCETVKTLNQLGILYAGAGCNLEEAQEPAILSLKEGCKLHIISAADHYQNWTATKGRPGIFWFDLQDPQVLLDYVAEYQQTLGEKDLLMVSLHWGPNWEAVPSPEKKELAQKLVKLGVKIIHGHSAHHLQPYEILDGSVIFYSLGDFIDDYAVNAEYQSNIGGLGIVELDTKGNITQVKLVPTCIDHLQVNL